MKSIRLHWIILITLTLYTATGLSNAPTTPAAKPTSDAIELAKQAGAIAGIAQACGQDITLLNQRVKEAIQTLTRSGTEQKFAINVYYQTTQVAQRTQQKRRVVQCHNALMELQKLPLLQSDYKTNVLEKFK